MDEEEVCMIEGCDRPERARGLCGKCYTAAGRLVSRGATTWDALADMGLARRLKSGPRGLFVAAFEAKVGGRNGCLVLGATGYTTDKRN